MDKATVEDTTPVGSPSGRVDGPAPSAAGGVWSQVLPVTLVFLVACSVFFTALGQFPLFNPDEGLFAEPAREILDTGEWTTSLLNYVVRFTKPPLVMWAMALAYQVFGVNEFAARFFGAASGAVLVGCTYCLLARYAGTRAAMFGSATLMTAPLFVGTARMAITDMPLSLFLAGSLMCFYRAFAEKDGFWRWAGYVLVGLAVMTKGPVAVVLPIAILSVYHLLRGSFIEALHFYRLWWGALIVAVIAVPWFAIEIAVTKGEYFRAFILRENFQRFTTVVDSHKGGWWYHVVAMMGGYFPWSVFVPQAIYRAFSSGTSFRSVRVIAGPAVERLRLDADAGASQGSFGDTIKGTSALTGFRLILERLRNLSARQDLLLYAACWSMITLVFFSLSVSKLMTYTLPAFPALAVLVALEIVAILEAGAIARLLAPLAVLAIIYGGAGLIGPVALHKLRNCPDDLFAILGGLVSFQCLLTVLAIALAILRKPRIAIALFTVLTLGSSAYFGYRAAATVAEHWEGALPDFARYAAMSPDPILLFDLRKPGVPFYTRRQVIHPSSREALEARLAGLERAYVLTKSSNRQFFETLNGCRTVAQQGYIMLVQWRRPGNLQPLPAQSDLGQADLSLAN